jgi:small subunit ribosomal protein S3
VGQKTHPLGFRLVTTQKHRSSWYANFNDYPHLLKEDDQIRSLFKTKLRSASIAKIKINRNSKGNQIELEVHSARPGILVGQAGSGIEELYSTLRKILPKDRQIIINIVEIKSPDTEATLIADFIAEQLESRVAFKRAMRQAAQKAQKANIKGIKIQVAGRLNGAEIARSEWIREGRVPLQTLRADIDYATKEAFTIYGILGIKVWLFKGEVI